MRLLQTCTFCGEHRGTDSPCFYCNEATVKSFDEALKNKKDYFALVKEYASNDLSLSDIHGSCLAWIEALIEASERRASEEALDREERKAAEAIYDLALNAKAYLGGPIFEIAIINGQATFYSHQFWNIIKDAQIASQSLKYGDRYDDDILISVLAQEEYARTSDILNKHGVDLWHIKRAIKHRGRFNDWLQADLEEYPPFGNTRDAEENAEAAYRFYNRPIRTKDEEESILKEEGQPAPFSVTHLISEMSTEGSMNPVTPIQLLESILTYGDVDWSNYAKGSSMEKSILEEISRLGED